jgi:hypothetical protein
MRFLIPTCTSHPNKYPNAEHELTRNVGGRCGEFVASAGPLGARAGASKEEVAIKWGTNRIPARFDAGPVRWQEAAHVYHDTLDYYPAGVGPWWWRLVWPGTLVLTTDRPRQRSTYDVRSFVGGGARRPR